VLLCQDCARVSELKSSENAGSVRDQQGNELKPVRKGKDRKSQRRKYATPGMRYGENEGGVACATCFEKIAHAGGKREGVTGCAGTPGKGEKTGLQGLKGALYDERRVFYPPIAPGAKARGAR